MIVKIYNFFKENSEQKMSAAGAPAPVRYNVSYWALMRREVGLPTKPRRLVLDPREVPSKEEDNSLKGSIHRPCYLVTKVFPQKGPIRITFTQLKKNFCTGDLEKCYKKVINYEGNGSGPFTRNQIIIGIQLRAKELYSHESEDFKNYVKRQSERLENIFMDYYEEKITQLCYDEF